MHTPTLCGSRGVATVWIYFEVNQPDSSHKTSQQWESDCVWNVESC